MARRMGLVLPAALIALLGMRWLTTHPSASRHWAVDQATPATTRFDGHLVRIAQVRDFGYDERGGPIPHYYDATYDLDSLTDVWFVLTTFSKRWRAPAHTFVSFGFADGRHVAISVEARREEGESYGILAGLLRSYELTYVIGDERDLIGRRAVVEGDDTYLYPVRAPREGIRALFVQMLERANALQSAPEFYNSLTNNCTSNLVRHVNTIAPGRIPAGWKVLVPGYADEVALRLGLIDASGDVEAARRRYQVNQRARWAMRADSFSARIREPARP
jgi:hypothetical protein